MARTKAAPRARFKFIDLFSGIGGTRLALEAAGGKCVFASEIDPNAVKTYFANFGDIPSGDVSAIDPKTIPPFDVLCAGFPCQPFSSIGKREGFMHATQGTMFHEILRIVQARGPKVLLLENVSGLVTHDRGRTLNTIVSALEETGYRVQYRVLDAAFYGVPQRRNRIYIVAMRKDLFSEFFAFQWPTPTEKPKTLAGIIESGVAGYEISKHLQKSYIHKIKDGRPQIINRRNERTSVAATLVASYHKIQRLTGTFVADGPTGLRLLTVGECKALMGFPQGFVIPVSRTQAYRQLGNSVAVPLVAQIAKAIEKSLGASRG